MATYYEILNVPASAEIPAIKKAYRLKVRTCHPDVAHGKDSHDLFHLVQEAYDTLSSPLKRWEYDRSIGIQSVRSNNRTLRSEDRPTVIRDEQSRVNFNTTYPKSHDSFSIRHYNWLEQILVVTNVVLALVLIFQLAITVQSINEFSRPATSPKTNTPANPDPHNYAPYGSNDIDKFYSNDRYHPP